MAASAETAAAFAAAANNSDTDDGVWSDSSEDSIFDFVVDSANHVEDKEGGELNLDLVKAGPDRSKARVCSKAGPTYCDCKKYLCRFSQKNATHPCNRDGQFIYWKPLCLLEVLFFGPQQSSNNMGCLLSPTQMRLLEEARMQLN